VTEPSARVHRTGRVGVYVHVPWCARRCPYCDFAVAVQARIPHQAYLDAILDELASKASDLADRALDSLYFGGGTPGLWEPECVAAVIDRVVRLGGRPAEITLEVNPEHRDEALWRRFVAAGVTRFSLGVQSSDPDLLSTLGRGHRPDQAADAVHVARAAGAERLSVDLMHGVPGSSLATVARDLAWLAALRDHVDHVSAYELTWEQGTGFWARRERGRLREVDEDNVVEQSRALRAGIEALGYARYEVSNFARPGYESVHNGGTWRGDEYLGLGVGAHGMRVREGQVERTSNPRSVRGYLGGERPVHEPIAPAEHLAECVFLALRTRDGFCPRRLLARFGGLAAQGRALARLIDEWRERGDLEEPSGDGRVRLRADAFDRADHFAEQAWVALT
jgi:putative oxygen-independent coproporphyrinogen III oxidase